MGPSTTKTVFFEQARMATDDRGTIPKQSPAVYRPPTPADRVFCQVVAQHLETYLYLARQGGLDFDAVPEYAEREFRKYVACGILAFGFARARCTGCGHDVPIPSSGKGRGICGSCNGRRMTELAAHLAESPEPTVADKVRPRQPRTSSPSRSIGPWATPSEPFYSPASSKFCPSPVPVRPGNAHHRAFATEFPARIDPVIQTFPHAHKSTATPARSCVDLRADLDVIHGLRMVDEARYVKAVRARGRSDRVLPAVVRELRRFVRDDLSLGEHRLDKMSLFLDRNL